VLKEFELFILRSCILTIVCLLVLIQPAWTQEIESTEKLPPRLGRLLSEPLLPLSLGIDPSVLAARQKPVGDSLVDLSVLYQQLRPSVLRLLVVEILPDQKRKLIGSGSAVAIDARTLVTNCHIVMKNDYLVFARDIHGKNHRLQIQAQDRGTDRCVYKAGADVFEAVKSFRPVSTLKIGERVFAIGNPKGFESVITEGLLAGMKSKAERRVLLTSANIAKGSSGGALFDYAGHLIGITMGIVNDAEYLGITIPISDFLQQR
jgi:S1-C subfamily serine protease